jgi:polyisoprenoid-binding protein YceI
VTDAFTSTNVEHIGGQNYQVTGNLTLRGVTRPITFDVIYHGQNSLMNTRPHLTAKATINRRDFGLGQGVVVRAVASSMVTVEIELEAGQQSLQAHEAASTAE